MLDKYENSAVPEVRYLLLRLLVLEVRHWLVHRLEIRGLGVHGFVISSLQGAAACTEMGNLEYLPR